MARPPRPPLMRWLLRWARLAVAALATTVLVVSAHAEPTRGLAARASRSAPAIVIAAPTTTLPAVVTTAAPPPRVGRVATPRRIAPVATGRIRIPRIGLDVATYEGIDPDEINFGPSHWPGTAEPGHVGNTVFAGHRVTFTHPFVNIDELEPGDVVVFERPQGEFVYAVTDHFVVDSDATWIAEQTDEATFTLFSCHPKHSARQRYVVVGRLVGPPVSDDAAASSAPAATTDTT
ncbi:MAG TPA: class E sortase, partial [Acidimicrobiales bacterium]|nr:class E sortase [Acidimicrobiales bacterium]